MNSTRPEKELSLRRYALQALGLLVILPFLTMFYVFREHLEGKVPVLFLVVSLSLLGFYLLWVLIRSISRLQRGLEKLSHGDASSLDMDREPSQFREMAEIINALNQLTIDFRENAQQLEHFIKQFATLAEITEFTARIPVIRELLSLILSKAVAATGARRGSVLLMQENNQDMEIVASDGWQLANPENCAVPLTGSIAEKVITTGKPLLVEHMDLEMDLHRGNDPGVYTSPSFLIMPLKTNSGTVGAVCLSEKRDEGPFTAQDQQFLTVLLGQVGFAVENARLLKHAREAAQHLKKTVLEQEREIEDAHSQILQSVKLSALGQLAGGVAHDFNNLLQAIIGHTTIAQQGLEQDHKRFAALEHVRRAAGRAGSLTGQLLAFGRRQNLQTQVLELNGVVEDMVVMMERLLGANAGIELKLVLDHEPGRVSADPRQVEQVLMNLCINARDAMPGGGRLTIRTGTTDLDRNFCDRHPWARTGVFCFFSVSDTGCGMDDETRRQLFEPFYTTKEPGRGTGLGLSTAYGIVKQHDGMIHVESAPGEGATFTVYLPVTNQPAEVREEPLEAKVVGGRETILLAEDEEAVREWATEILEEMGYVVLPAEDGRVALQLFENHADSVDLALIDAVMPEISGFELCRHILEVRPDVKILFCSGYSLNTLPGEFLVENDLKLLQKPFLADTLLRSVRETLDAQTKSAAS